MHAQTLIGHHVPNRKVAPISDNGRSENPIHRWAAERTLCSMIGGYLVNARARLNEMIVACDRGESLEPQVRIDESGRAIPQPATKAGNLERLRAGLERIATRFQTAASLIEVRYAPSPIDLGRAESRKTLELALAEGARTLAGRFDNPDVGRDLLADLESDLSDFERMLEAQAVLLDLNERQGPTQGSERTGVAGPARRPGKDVVGTRESRDNDLFRSFGAHLDTLRQVDRALRQIDRCVANARGDRPLQEYWRESKRRYREESHRLTRLIGYEAIRLDYEAIRLDRNDP